jgi:hypothetical protein
LCTKTSSSSRWMGLVLRIDLTSRALAPYSRIYREQQPYENKGHWVAIELLTCYLRPWCKDTNHFGILYPHVWHTMFVPAVAIGEYQSVTKHNEVREILLQLVTNVMMSAWRVWIDDPEFESRRGCDDRLWGTTNILSNGYGGSFPGGKTFRPRRLFTSLYRRGKNKQSYTSTPTLRLYVLGRDNFICFMTQQFLQNLIFSDRTTLYNSGR